MTEPSAPLLEQGRTAAARRFRPLQRQPPLLQPQLQPRAHHPWGWPCCGRLAAAVGGKLLGVHAAGRWLGWPAGEASTIGWLLQTKALIMIIFSNVLLDRQVITSETFTALLLMAVASTMLTVPVVAPRLLRAAPAAIRPSLRSQR